jgi:hypothetical protein
VLREACRELETRLQSLEAQGIEALAAVPREHAEVLEFDSGAAHLFTLKVELNLTETLVVLTVAVPTLWLPTFISTAGIGHIASEGLVFSSDGTVREAPDHLMGQYR